MQTVSIKDDTSMQANHVPGIVKHISPTYTRRAMHAAKSRTGFQKQLAYLLTLIKVYTINFFHFRRSIPNSDPGRGFKNINTRNQFSATYNYLPTTQAHVDHTHTVQSTLLWFQYSFPQEHRPYQFLVPLSNFVKGLQSHQPPRPSPLSC